jgi:hypothetical protein
MAAANQLDRIAALAAALAPLAGKQRGMRIEADDWNALVAAVKGILEIDRSQEEGRRAALADAYAPRAHEHLGTVSVAWLAADLQSRIGDASSGVSLLATVGDLRRRLEASEQEVARLTAAIEDIQRRFDRSTVDDVDRTNRLRGYEDRLTGIEDLKVTVGGMTGTIDALRPRIDDVLALQAHLTDAQGNPVDIGVLQGQIQDLQVLRESLVGSTGEPLHLLDFETQITDLKHQLDQTTAGGIDQRLSTLTDELQGRLTTQLDERATTLRTDLTGEIQAGRDASTEQLRRELDAARVTIDETLTAKVGEAETRLTATLDARDQQLTAAIRADVTASTQAQIDAGLATLPGIVDSRITVAEGRLGGVIDQRLNDRLTNVLLPHRVDPTGPGKPGGRPATRPRAAGAAKPAGAKPGGAKPAGAKPAGAKPGGAKPGRPRDA